MSRLIRMLGTCCAVLIVFAARAEAASVTLAWDPNSESDIAGYYVGYRTSPTASETLVLVAPSACSSSSCMWTLSTAIAGTTYYFRVYAENTSGLRSAPSNEVATTIPTTPPPPSGGGLALERGALNYGAVGHDRYDPRPEDASAAHDGHADGGRRTLCVDGREHGHG